MSAPGTPIRVALALPAALALAGGVLSGLARLGVPMPDFVAGLAGVHGALLTGGFFGTVIGLERAVAMGRAWPYCGPAASAAAALVMLAGGSAMLAATLLCVSAAVMALACLSLVRREPALHLAVLAAAAVAWLCGNITWLVTGAMSGSVMLWCAFLILTIAAERLELSRLRPTSRAARGVFSAIVLLLAAGAVIGAVDTRPFAAGLVLLAAWLVRHDIARHTLKAAGLTRYMAICLLAGYVWLAVAGLLGVAGAFAAGSPWRDAGLHALLLGFVFSMVFGHAPIILPAVTRLRFAWNAGFYLPLAMLHASLIARVVAGLAGDLVWRQWAGAGNALALFVFVLLTITRLRARPRAHAGHFQLSL